MSTGLALFLLVLLLAGNAFFVAAEFAMVTARRDQIEPQATNGSRTARWALKGIENVTIALAASQLGITACSLLIGAVGEPAIAVLIEVPLVSLGVPQALIHPIALVIALLIVTYFHMVLGEMVPKNIAIAKPAESALILGPVLHVFVVLFRPLIWFMNTLANVIVRHVFRATPRDEVASTYTTEEVAGFVAESGREGLLDEDEIRLLQGALDFESLTAADVAIPAHAVCTVPVDATVAQVEETCARTGFSRFPLQQRDGTLKGYIHVKDLLNLASQERSALIPSEAIHELISVPPDAKLRQVVSIMQRWNVHLALIQGESTQAHAVAVITLEDVLEELVGEIADATRS